MLNPISDLVNVDIIGGKHVRLNDELAHFCSYGNVMVPAGFVSDLASIPRVFWRIAPPWDAHCVAAVVHDFIYVTGHCGGATQRPFTRKQADLLFLHMMEQAGVGWAKRHAMYRAVRMFGRGVWSKKGRNA